jgi:hypothetical protein
MCSVRPQGPAVCFRAQIRVILWRALTEFDPEMKRAAGTARAFSIRAAFAFFSRNLWPAMAIFISVATSEETITRVKHLNPVVRIISPTNNSALLAPFDRLLIRISGVPPAYPPMTLLLLDHAGSEIMRATVSAGEDDEDPVDFPILLHGLQTMSEAITRIALLAPDQAETVKPRVISEDTVRFRIEVGCLVHISN